MAKGGKLLAILGGILVLIGTYGLSLYFDGVDYFYGIGYFTNFSSFTALFTSGNWVLIIVGVVVILYLLAGVLILIGIKIRALAFIGALFPLAMVTFCVLYQLGIYTAVFDLVITPLGGGFPPLVPQWVPLSFSQIVFNGIDLGAYVVGLGALLGLISSFMPRDDF